MTELKCDVQTCAYNKAQLCSKGDIIVGGRQAKSANDTRCESFRDKQKDHFVSSLDHPAKSISIDCEACDCKYNTDYRCSAAQVTISGNQACDCKGTLCSTFQEKMMQEMLDRENQEWYSI